MINMTPQEKANELVNKHRIVLIQSDTDAGEEIICTTIAKQCALVVVDEVIANIEPSVSMDIITARIKYWQEVKEEIEKL
jgi:hypothetical protein